MHYELDFVHGVEDVLMHDVNFNAHAFAFFGEGINELLKGNGAA